MSIKTQVEPYCEKCKRAECKCEKEHVTPEIKMQLMDFKSLKAAVQTLVSDIVPRAIAGGEIYALNRVSTVWKELKSQNFRLKCTVGCLIGAIVGNIIACIF